MILFHGSENKIESFKEGVIFLTESEQDAKEFGLGSHILGSARDIAYLYTIEAKPGKTFDANEIIEKFIADEDDPLFGEYTDLDKWILDVYGSYLRDIGYRYFKFQHPSFVGEEILVTVSLYPPEDLAVMNEKIISE